MKYTMNHSYMFSSPSVAFTMGLMNAVVSSLTEIVNIGIILTAEDPFNIVMNFVSITIVAQFDNFVYDSMRNEVCKKLIEFKLAEKVLIIHHTTSKRCGWDELADNYDEEGNRRKLRINFIERGCGNKFGYCIYKVFRIWAIGFYFYFMPFAAVMLSILLPLLAPAHTAELPQKQQVFI